MVRVRLSQCWNVCPSITCAVLRMCVLELALWVSDFTRYQARQCLVWTWQGYRTTHHYKAHSVGHAYRTTATTNVYQRLVYQIGIKSFLSLQKITVRREKNVFFQTYFTGDVV